MKVARVRHVLACIAELAAHGLQRRVEANVLDADRRDLLSNCGGRDINDRSERQPVEMRAVRETGHLDGSQDDCPYALTYLAHGSPPSSATRAILFKSTSSASPSSPGIVRSFHIAT